jgi:hypothetical protein
MPERLNITGHSLPPREREREEQDSSNIDHTSFQLTNQPYQRKKEY